MIMAPRSTETQSITLKNMALFRPTLRDSLSINQIVRFVREQCLRSFDSNDAVDKILNEVAAEGS